MKRMRAMVVSLVIAGGLCGPPTLAWAQPAPLQLVALEINQGVQSLGNAVPLIAGREAVVRAYIVNTAGALTLTGRLTVTVRGGASEEIASSSAFLASPTTASGVGTMRPDPAKTLNFLVPGTALHGPDVSMTVALFSGSQQQACEGCDLPRTRQLLAVPPLRLKIVALRYRFDNRVYAPRDNDWNAIRLWLERVYPVPSVDLTTRVVDAKFAWPFTCSDAMAQVQELRAAEVANAASVDPRTHYYALVYGDDVGTFMRGCADVPELPDPGAVGAGPTGPVTKFPGFAWDADGSFGDWYAGHEIAHTFGRAHPGQCGSGAPLDAAFFPSASGEPLIKSVRLAQSDDPFDSVGLDRRTDPWAVLPGTQWHDVMDYCSHQWISPYTYHALAVRLMAESELLDPQFTGLTSPGVLTTDGEVILPSPLVLPPPSSPATGPGPTPLPPGSGESQQIVKPTAEGELLTVIARVNREKGTGVVDSILPVRRTFSKSYGTPADESRGATLRVTYRGGETRLYGCDMRAISRDPESNARLMTPSRETLSQPTAPVTNQTVEYDTSVVCTFPAGGVPDRAVVLIDGKAVIEHLSPKGNVQVRSASPLAGGAGGPAGSMKYRWTASGQSPTTRYLVKVSTDDGRTWNVLSVGQTQTEIDIAPEDVSGATQFLLEITAMDGMRTSVLERKVLNVPGPR